MLRVEFYEFRKIHPNLSAKHTYQYALKISAKTDEKCKSLRLFGEIRIADFANGDNSDFKFFWPYINIYADKGMIFTQNMYSMPTYRIKVVPFKNIDICLN